MRDHRYADTGTVAEAHRLYGMGMSAIQIASRLGFSDRAVFRWLQKPSPAPPVRMPDLSGGLCAETDGELFFGDRGEHKQAKKLCQRCPIMAACRAYGVSHPELSGIWGGLSQHARQRLAR